MKKEIKIGLIGLGVIGGQVAKVLHEKKETLSLQAGVPLRLARIKVLPSDLEKPIVKQLPSDIFTTHDDELFDDPAIDIIIELIGGEKPAYDYIRRALENGKHVVTANKEVIAKHGIELRNMAHEKGISLYYEASVGGGIPLIAPLEKDLSANYIKSIHAIINGTTNYILTRMSKEGIDFDIALANAQKLGYAEANPKNDIEGIDAAYKIAIMATLAFQCEVSPDVVYNEGISKLNSRDFRYAGELGYEIKLLAIAKQHSDSIEARVHPAFIHKDSVLAGVNGVFNSVSIEGDLVGQVVFTGQGAGPLATSSAVVSDVLRAAKDELLGTGTGAVKINTKKPVRPIKDVTTRYYMRLSILDSTGVLAAIAQVLGEHEISIASVIQKETDTLSQSAEIVIMTHPATGCAVENAIAELSTLDVVKEVNNIIRVEEQ
jgi:homoserine dehydrogenase